LPEYINTAFRKVKIIYYFAHAQLRLRTLIPTNLFLVKLVKLLRHLRYRYKYLYKACKNLFGFVL
jgi:hypothetical protein